MLRLRRAAYKLKLYGHWDSNLVRFSRDVFTRTCWTFRYAFHKIRGPRTYRGPRTHGCYFSNFQNCHNCDNCCHRDSSLFFFSTIATIATIAVIRSQLYLFQNCHNCDNCDGKRIHIFFCLQNCHNCDNCGHRDSYISELHESLLLCQRDAILAIFRIAIIATIVVTGIHLCFFHNCHNCNNCCHQESTVPFSELP